MPSGPITSPPRPPAPPRQPSPEIEVVRTRIRPRVEQPTCTLDDTMRTKLLALARDDPLGFVVRGDWVAIADFSSRWQTAFVQIDCPADLVCTIAECLAYARGLHAELAGAYVAAKLPMPMWRSWGNILKAWPFLHTPFIHQPVHQPVQLAKKPSTTLFVPKPVFSKVKIIRPL